MSRPQPSVRLGLIWTTIAVAWLLGWPEQAQAQLCVEEDAPAHLVLERVLERGESQGSPLTTISVAALTAAFGDDGFRWYDHWIPSRLDEIDEDQAIVVSRRGALSLQAFDGFLEAPATNLLPFPRPIEQQVPTIAALQGNALFDSVSWETGFLDGATPAVLVTWSSTDVGGGVATVQAIVHRPPGNDVGDLEVEFRYAGCSYLNFDSAIVGFDEGMTRDRQQNQGAQRGRGWHSPASSDRNGGAYWPQLLCSVSNVGIPGIWRYQFVQGQPTGCGIDHGPGIPDERCRDGNIMYADGCTADCRQEGEAGQGGCRVAPQGAVDPFCLYEDGGMCRPDEVVDICPEHEPDPSRHPWDPDSLVEIMPWSSMCSVLHLSPAGHVDQDRDQVGDVCDFDIDSDGFMDCDRIEGGWLCPPWRNGVDDDADGRVDEFPQGEAGECFHVSTCQFDANSLDDDVDGVADEAGERSLWIEDSTQVDLCPRTFNQANGDIDGDGIGDACDPDKDGDGILDCGADGRCNPMYDGIDSDGDLRIDNADRCEEDALCGVQLNAQCRGPGQPCQRNGVDEDRDGRVDELECDGNLCGEASSVYYDNLDEDCDGRVDEWSGELLNLYQPDHVWPALRPHVVDPGEDNCPLIQNPDQRDVDADGVGDECDDDRDGDGMLNVDEACPDLANPPDVGNDPTWCANADDDGHLDRDDNCPQIANNDQLNTDGDDLGDECDPDDDNDGIMDPHDECALIPGGLSNGCPDMGGAGSEPDMMLEAEPEPDMYAEPVPGPPVDTCTGSMPSTGSVTLHLRDHCASGGCSTGLFARSSHEPPLLLLFLLSIFGTRWRWSRRRSAGSQTPTG